MKNVALQCEKKCRENLGENGWEEERSEMLKKQLNAMANPEEAIRTISSEEFDSN